MQPIDCPPLRDFAESDCPFSLRAANADTAAARYP
jgi:hypothetical protein